MREIETKKISLAYYEFAYKKTNLGDRFLKKANFQSLICKIADKKTAHNEVRLYSYNGNFDYRDQMLSATFTTTTTRSIEKIRSSTLQPNVDTCDKRLCKVLSRS